MKKITSSTNPSIKNLKKLFLSKYRKEKQEFLAEGSRTCKTLFDAGYKLIDCYITEKNEELARILFKDFEITIISEGVAEVISQASTPSGILCKFQIPEQPDYKSLSQGIVLVNISDPGNMGTLIRTAAALNKKTIAIIDGADPWSHKVIQATAGTIALANILQISWDELQKNKGELKLCALVTPDGEKPNKKLLQNSLLIIGNEAHGIPEKITEACDTKITLEMPGKTESLNAAIAGSIAMYLSL